MADKTILISVRILLSINLIVFKYHYWWMDNLPLSYLRRTTLSDWLTEQDKKKRNADEYDLSASSPWREEDRTEIGITKGI